MKTNTRVFVYARVSTADQTTDNQLLEIESAGFSIDKLRVVTESISGSHAAMLRPAFCKLIDRLEEGDVLVVTKLDRLGRNVVDVTMTVERLKEIGVRVHCLQLGGMDLTSPAGRMTMTVLLAVAQFERDLIIERTKSGLERAKAQGKHLGRHKSLDEDQRAEVLKRLDAGDSVSLLARDFETSRMTIMRVRDGV